MGAFLLLGCYSHAQGSGDEKDTYLKINALKVGYGIPYGGTGLNYEFGYNSLTTYATVGYLWGRLEDTVKLAGSINYGIGFRYHRINAQGNVIPRAGIHFGWVDKYYDRRISEEMIEYDPDVYGLALTIGAEWYLDPILLDGDLAIIPANGLILNEEKHPYYRQMNFAISLGIGIDFGEVSLFRKKRYDVEFE